MTPWKRAPKAGQPDYNWRRSRSKASPIHRDRHRLFADALQTRLRQLGYEHVQTLHRRASAWYEQHELLPEAIHHALAAAAFVPATQLIERVGLAAFAQAVVQHSLGNSLRALPSDPQVAGRLYFALPSLV